MLFVLMCFFCSAQPDPLVIQYIAKYKGIAIQEMRAYRIPASITLAQGLLESANGKSELAVKANNHFGIKCKSDWTGQKYYYDDDEKNECFRKYSSDSASYLDHSVFLTTRQNYAFLFQYSPMDYKAWAYGLKKAGYATNPKYAELLIKIIQENRLSYYDSVAFNIDISMNKTDVQLEKKISSEQATIILKDSTNKTSDHKQALQHPIESNIKNENDFPEIIIGECSRKVYTNNGVNYIIARKYDTYYLIAKDFDLEAYDVRKYNDATQKNAVREGDIIYIQPKEKRNNIEFHTALQGETMRDISQKYAIQLSSLLKKNHMAVNQEPVHLQKIWLKNNKPEN